MTNSWEGREGSEKPIAEQIPQLLGTKGKYWSAEYLDGKPEFKARFGENEVKIKELNEYLETAFSKTQGFFRDDGGLWNNRIPDHKKVIDDFIHRVEVLPPERKKLVTQSMDRLDHGDGGLSAFTKNGRKLRGKDVLTLASILAGESISVSDPESVKQALNGKKILVLGDDVGTLSEVLRSFGADAYGLEGRDLYIDIAQSGVLAENSQPQNQVIKGNISEIIAGKKDLMEKLRALGPFDAIFSTNLFTDSGYSGIQAIVDRTSSKKVIDEGSHNPGAEYLIKSDELLKENGLQVHDEIDDYMMPISYRMVPDRKFYENDDYAYVEEDPFGNVAQLFDRGVSANKEAQQILRAGYVKTSSLAKRGGELVVCRKGTIEKLSKMSGVVATKSRRPNE